MTRVVVTDLAAFLAGRWHLERTITDHRDARTSRLVGLVRFDPDGIGLAYSEHGALEVAGAPPIEVSRALRFSFIETARAEVCFADGRPFHDLDLRSGRWRARHDCAPDRYRGTFATAGPDRLWVRWRVRGPAKSYVSTSALDRLA